MAEDVLAILKKALTRVGPRPSEIVTLIYWSQFAEPDGRGALGFAPGYAVGCLEGPPGDNWTLLRLPDGTKIPFWPRFAEHEADWLRMTFASRTFETFALAAIVGRRDWAP